MKREKICHWINTSEKLKGLAFLVAKAVKNFTNHSLKQAKVFWQWPIPQFISIFPSTLDLSGLVRNLPPHGQKKKDLIVLQTNRLSNLSSA